MDKRGFQLSLIEMLKLILGLLIIFGIFIPLGTGIYNFFTQKPDKQTLDNLESLMAEINDLEDGQSITVPIYLKDKINIISFNKNDANLPRTCKGRACLCLYKEDFKIENEPFACEVTDDRSFKETRVIIQGQKGILSLEIKNQENNISINQPTKTI